MARSVLLPDDKVFLYWYCPDCESEQKVNPDSFQDMGNPMCCDCDTEMTYSHTELEK
jgi:ribosomal protein S27E